MSKHIHFTVVAILLSNEAKAGKPYFDDTVIVEECVTENPLGHEFLGGSFHYYQANDELRGEGETVALYSELDTRLIRFPGGTESDNYLWDYDEPSPFRTPDVGPLYDASHHPCDEPTKPCTQDTLANFREHLGNVEAFESEIDGQRPGEVHSNFVVNIIGAFGEWSDAEAVNPHVELEPYLETWAQYAASWVQEVKDQGSYVKYWEIGNEPYYKLEGNYAGRVTKEQYVTAFRVFSDAMKSVDGRILVGAVGDWKTDSGRNQSWWPHLADRLGPSIDFAAIHHYSEKHFRSLNPCSVQADCPDGTHCWRDHCKELDFSYLDEKFSADPQLLEHEIEEIREILEDGVGRPVPILITEWNVRNKVHRAVSFHEHMLFATDILGRLVDSGVNAVQYWPMDGSGWWGFPLESVKDGRVHPAKALFKKWGRYLHRNRVKLTRPEGQMYTFGSCETTGVASLFLVNKYETPRHVRVEGMLPYSFTVEQYFASDNKEKSDEDAAEGMTECSVDIDGTATCSANGQPKTNVSADLVTYEQGWQAVTLRLPAKSLVVLSNSHDLETRKLRHEGIGTYEAGTRSFFLDLTGDGLWDARKDQIAAFGGKPGDTGLVGDWSRDGYSNVGLFRPGDYTFSQQQDYDDTWDSGEEWFVRMVGSYDGVGDTGIGLSGNFRGWARNQAVVYYPTDNHFAFDWDNSRAWDESKDRRQYIHAYSNEVPFSGDWNCDGKDQVGVYANKTFYLYGTADFELVDEVGFFRAYAREGDLPVIGDWNGDGCDEMGIYRPRDSVFALDLDGDGVMSFKRDFVRGFAPGETPVAGYWRP